MVILPVNSIPPIKNRISENARLKNRSSERVSLKKRSTAILIHCNWSLFRTYPFTRSKSRQSRVTAGLATSTLAEHNGRYTATAARQLLLV